MCERIKKRFSAEYVEFLLIHSPQVCAKCRNGSFTTLWLANRTMGFREPYI